ncbi:MAG TPA: rRNA maturation RNase YbeY [Mogibacterium sp.]|nr:rRNA maturation RNase YbeY [Mogibacterium sp.]
MNIYYSDELGRITSEIESFINKAADIAVSGEFNQDRYEINTANLQLALSVTIVDKDEIQDLNREYRGIDKNTDVLSFPQFDSKEKLLNLMREYAYLESDSDFELPEIPLGDVVICWDVAEEQAEEYETGIIREILYLFTHSIFHLLGYDHEEEEERVLMRMREEEVMDSIGVSR